MLVEQIYSEEDSSQNTASFEHHTHTLQFIGKGVLDRYSIYRSNCNMEIKLFWEKMLPPD